MNVDLPIARLRRERYLRLHVRDWGLPTAMYVGTTWRTMNEGGCLPVVCIVAPGESPDTRRVLVAKVAFLGEEACCPNAGERPEAFPPEWCAWMAEYVRRWPDSGREIAPWADLSINERCDLATQALSVRNDPVSAVSRMLTARALLTVWPTTNVGDADAWAGIP